MKVKYLGVLVTSINIFILAKACPGDLFTRVLSVNHQNLSLDIRSSDIGIRSRVMCASKCQYEDGCLSFSYTQTNGRCDTYSRLLYEEENADMSNCTMYFSLASGLYNIRTAGGDHIQVYNDMETPNGPWIVIQRRTIGDVDFYREWAAYKKGFGDLHGDFWIGNDNLNLLTTTPRILRVELEAEDGEKGYAEYSNFTVANEGQKYKLFVGGFSGNLSFDAMENHHDQRFSTYDQDNDRAHIHCAVQRHGGWWYKWCYRANLNGRYMRGDGADLATSMNWWYFPNGVQLTPLRKSKMMIR